MEGFKYVIRKQQRQLVCFGSGCHRDSSKRGMSPFMKHSALEDNSNVSPNSYEVLTSFKAINTRPCSHSISKKGYSGIARFGQVKVITNCYPSPSSYYISSLPQKVQTSKYPFQSGSKRQSFIGNKNPGPGMYMNVKKKKTTFEHSFGGRAKLKLGVDLKCCSRNMDICRICEKKIVGDYWHFKNKIFLCRSCMDKDREGERKFKRRELVQFQKVRDCSIMHQHGNTAAKIWLICPKSAAEWLCKESYLSSYFSR